MPVKTPMKTQTNLTTMKHHSSIQKSALAGAISSATSVSAILGDAITGDAVALSTSTAFNSPAYHELLENPHVELDGLQRLQENLAQLEDLHGRLRFMMRDLTTLIRRR